MVLKDIYIYLEGAMNDGNFIPFNGILKERFNRGDLNFISES